MEMGCERSTWVHNGHGNGHGNGNGQGNGKRWLLIALLVLGGFWLVNDAYDDGYRDALVQTGQAGSARYYRGGPHFPWGLVIVGGIAYVAYRKGAFDRFGGPGGPFGNGGNGQRGVQPYGAQHGPAFRGPRAFFDEWHRQSHEAHQAWQTVHSAPPTPPAPPAQTHAQTGNGSSHEGVTQAQAPAPTPPAADYWTTLGGQTATAAPPANPEARPGEQPGGTAGPTTERW